jgi:hypothetical protein
MHWNSIRYCIGFPPESWYEIADSLGFLIQDEYPIWTLGAANWDEQLRGLTPERLAGEYSQWMRERWNHPCVVIWDAQNESVTEVTGKAIQLVRDNDLSNRPWDNGWAAPQSETDCMEAHPYRFSRYRHGGKPSQEGALKDHFSKPSRPDNDPVSHALPEGEEMYRNATIINEYGWIWLNRNGTPTTLTDKVYENVFPEADTPEKRYVTYAKHLGMVTEYWRAHRQCAGVLHFCGLGYSRPDEPRGQTSDHFTDIRQLIYETQFYTYVRPAFHPVGLMLDMWDKKVEADKEIRVPLHVINDLNGQWSEDIEISLQKEGKIIQTQTVSFTLPPFGKKIQEVALQIPAERGACQMVAELIFRTDTIRSIRDFRVE